MRTHELNFATADRDRGQIVTYSYAYAEDGRRICQRHDASDGSVGFSWADTGDDLAPDEKARYGLVSRG